MVDTTMDPLAWVREQVEQPDTDLLREIVKLFCERVMSEEADAICGASYGERSDERTDLLNGYRSRTWDTRTGAISLEIPKLRVGTYCDDPGWRLRLRPDPSSYRLCAHGKIRRPCSAASERGLWLTRRALPRAPRWRMRPRAMRGRRPRHVRLIFGENHTCFAQLPPGRHRERRGEPP